MHGAAAGNGPRHLQGQWACHLHRMQVRYRDDNVLHLADGAGVPNYAKADPKHLRQVQLRLKKMRAGPQRRVLLPENMPRRLQVQHAPAQVVDASVSFQEASAKRRNPSAGRPKTAAVTTAHAATATAIPPPRTPPAW